MKILRYCFSALLALFVFGCTARGLEEVYYPSFRDLKELHYQTRDQESGRPLFRDDIYIRETTREGKTFLVTSALSRGEDGQERRTVSHYLINGDCLSAYAHRLETTRNGILQQKTDIDYDWSNKQAQLTQNDLKNGKIAKKTFILAPSFLFSRDTTILFPSLISQGVKETDLKIMIPTGHVLSVRAFLSYITEDFMIRGKKYSCYRVELRPAFSLLSLVAPRLTFWYLSSPPYYFVRYEGPLGGPFSPRVVQELAL